MCPPLRIPAQLHICRQQPKSITSRQRTYPTDPCTRLRTRIYALLSLTALLSVSEGILILVPGSRGQGVSLDLRPGGILGYVACRGKKFPMVEIRNLRPWGKVI